MLFRSAAAAVAGVAAGGDDAIGTVQPLTIKATEAAANNLDAIIPVIASCQGDRSNDSLIWRGSSFARFAVNTRSHLALL